MDGKVMRVVRIAVSLCVLGVLTCGLLCGAAVLPGVGAWLERLQLGPAVISFSMVIIVGWLLVTLLFGRVYCSTLCPMGTLQDIFARITRRGSLESIARSRHRYRYAPPATRLRFAVLLVVLGCLMIGFMLLPLLVGPYTLFTRICNFLVTPAVQWVASWLGVAATHPGAAVVTASLAATLVTFTLLMAVVVIAVRSGRTLCSTVCPIGTALGCVSRFAVYQMDIDTDLCINCGKCADVCKASCIKLPDHLVDGSRCVVCFDCTAVCPNGAIRFTRNRKQLSTPLMERIASMGRQPQTSLNCSNHADRSSGNEIGEE